MKLTKATQALSASILVLSVLGTPAMAQDAQADEETEAVENEDLDTAAKVGIGTAAAYGASKLVRPHSDPAPDMRAMTPEERIRNNIVGNNGSVTDLERRGNLAQQVRANRAATTGVPVDMADLEVRGNAAQRARANAVGGSADDLARLEARGNAAQGARANRIGSGANLDQLDRQGRFAQDSRGRGIGHTGNVDLEARGNAAQNSRFRARNINAAANGGQSFDRALQGRIGPEGTSRLIGQGDAAQAARGRVVNEGQIARNIHNAGGDVGRLNQAGRSAQATRGLGRAAGSADDLAKIASTGAKVGRAGKAGRAVLAASGAGAVAVAAEYAATESVKALTGAEIQDPFSTGFQYGAAIFDKDVTLGDVARARAEHHRENFRAIGETLTTEGKWVDNLEEYADSKNPMLGNVVRNVDQFDRQKRALVKDATGIEMERMTDVGSRYLGALKEERKLKALGDVAASRAEHHLDNAAAVLGKTRDGTRALGAATRQGVGNATGADLRSVRETTGRYADALKGPDKIKNVGEVAGDRAKHHWENTKKVGSKVSCGIGNIFRKKENDKEC